MRPVLESIQIEGFRKALFEKMRDRSTDFGRDYLGFCWMKSWWKGRKSFSGAGTTQPYHSACLYL